MPKSTSKLVQAAMLGMMLTGAVAAGACSSGEKKNSCNSCNKKEGTANKCSSNSNSCNSK